MRGSWLSVVVVAAACTDGGPADVESSTFFSSCDGCGSSSTSSTTSPGAVFRLEVDGPDTRFDSGEGVLWGDGVGATLVRVGDVDGDGETDFAAAADDGWRVYGSGRGRTPLALLSGPPRRVGDLDGDGEVDLVVDGVGGAYLTTNLLLPNFSEATATALPDGVSLGAAPDLDGDGWPETTWRDDDVSGVRVVRLVPSVAAVTAPETALAAAWLSIPLEGVDGFSPRTFDAGDLDGDGVGELAVTSTVDGGTGPVAQLTVYAGGDLAVGTIAPIARLFGTDGLGGSMELAAVGDVDGDGTSDVVVRWVRTAGVSEVRGLSGASLRGDEDLALAGFRWVDAAVGFDVVDTDGDGLAEGLVVGVGWIELYDGTNLGADAIPDGTVAGATSAALRRGSTDTTGSVWAGDPDWRG